MTKVVTFGAFVEIHPGVEGLVHISELAAHHVENPREVVNQGDVLAVRIIEIDADRRRLSLSLKRVADSDPIQHHLPDDIRAAAVGRREVAGCRMSADGGRGGRRRHREAVVEEAEAEAEAEAAEEAAPRRRSPRRPRPSRGRGRGARRRGSRPSPRSRSADG